MGKEFNSNQLKNIFKNYSEKLVSEITILKDKFNLYNNIIEYENKLSNSNFFMLVYNSLFTDIIITLSKFYENLVRKRNSDFDINDFLNLCDKINNSKKEFFIYYKGDESISNKIKEHKDKIEEIKPIIKKLLTWRDKKVAHFDKEPFINRQYLIKNAPLSKEELEKSIKIITDILNTYTYAHSRKIYVTENKNIKNLNIEEIIDLTKNIN